MLGTMRSVALIALVMTLAGIVLGEVAIAGPGKVVPAGRGRGHWRTYDVSDGLANPYVSSILQDREGALWFGTGVVGAPGNGVSRYDGQTWTTFTTEVGLANDHVPSIFQDREGYLWFGTWGGVSRYDGQTWTTYTTKDGLASNWVYSIIQDKDGHLWFGTWKGVSRYDGQSWTTFTTEDGLADNTVRSIVQGREGDLWFGTVGGGVSCFDGRIFQTLTRRDGIGSNLVSSIVEDRTGVLWFGTSGGVTRFQAPASAPPSIVIEAVVADRRYAEVGTATIPSTVRLIAFEFAGLSFKTRPGGMAYRYRLKGHDEDWATTRKRRVEYQDVPRGRYIFEVLAVDRDLTYSEMPATVVLTVHLPYERVGWISALTIAVLSIVWQTVRVIRRDRRLRDEAESELQTAHDMQMALMPASSPRIEGFDIAGRCIPANHVGGDFYQYFLAGDKLNLCLADVTGAAMEAAIPVVMFNGILDRQMELEGGVEATFAALNRALHRTLDSRTFVCFTMAEINPLTRSFRLSNAGCPYPYHYLAETGQVTELQVSAYPLGVRANTEYDVIEAQLQAGDRLVFCSDGIVEAENADGDQYGYDRMMQTVRAVCEADLPAEDTIDRMLAKVKAFSGDVSQADDMTCVVVKVT